MSERDIYWENLDWSFPAGLGAPQSHHKTTDYFEGKGSRKELRNLTLLINFTEICKMVGKS